MRTPEHTALTPEREKGRLRNEMGRDSGVPTFWGFTITLPVDIIASREADRYE